MEPLQSIGVFQANVHIELKTLRSNESPEKSIGLQVKMGTTSPALGRNHFVNTHHTAVYKEYGIISQKYGNRISLSVCRAAARCPANLCPRRKASVRAPPEPVHAHAC